ncbi:hypothetical protein PFISCL1PPCAC_20139, partial [Pristionchus fissidentatus]
VETTMNSIEDHLTQSDNGEISEMVDCLLRESLLSKSREVAELKRELLATKQANEKLKSDLQSTTTSLQFVIAVKNKKIAELERKRDETPMALKPISHSTSPLLQHEGFWLIRTKFSGVNDLKRVVDASVISDPFHLEGLNWRIRMRRVSRAGKGASLAAYAEADHPTNPHSPHFRDWSCAVVMKFRLMSFKHTNDFIATSISLPAFLNQEKPASGAYLTAIEPLLTNDREFFKEDSLLLESYLKV